MLVVWCGGVKTGRLCQSRSGRQGTGLRIGQDMVSERDDSQGSIWGLSMSEGWIG